MSCSEENLERYLDGKLKAEENAAVEEHLRACPRCRETLRAWRAVDAALQTYGPLAAALETPPEQHPEEMQLAAYLSEGLPPAEREQVVEHLVQCSDCREDVIFLRQALREEVMAPSEPADRRVVEALLQRIQASEQTAVTGTASPTAGEISPPKQTEDPPAVPSEEENWGMRLRWCDVGELLLFRNRRRAGEPGRQGEEERERKERRPQVGFRPRLVAIPVAALLLVGGALLLVGGAFLAFSHFRAEAPWQSVLGADNTPGQVRELRDETGLEYRYERNGETIQVRVVGDIYQEYTQLDQHRGPLAFPLTRAREGGPSPYTTTRGKYQVFIRGAMYDLEGPGRAFYMDDDIHLRYWDEDSQTGWGQGRGGPQGPLGWPQGNPVDIRVGQVMYCFQKFEQGAMYDTTPPGQEPIATYTLGPIHEKYWDTKTWGAGKEGYQSVLGWPNADPRPAPVSPGGLTGEMQTFDHGAILSSDYGTFYLTGEIGVFYRDQGYSGSRLGFPLTDPYTPPEGGTKQDFTGPLTATEMKARGGAPGASIGLTPTGTLKTWVAEGK